MDLDRYEMESRLRKDVDEIGNGFIAAVVANSAALTVAIPFDFKVPPQPSSSTITSPFLKKVNDTKVFVQKDGLKALFQTQPRIPTHYLFNGITFALYQGLKEEYSLKFDANYKSFIPSPPIQSKQDFYSKELLQRYSLPQSFRAQITSSPNTPSSPSVPSSLETYSTIATNPTHPHFGVVFSTGAFIGSFVAYTLNPRLDPALAPYYRGFWGRGALSCGLYFLAYEWTKWKMRTETFTPQVIVNGQILSPNDTGASEVFLGTKSETEVSRGQLDDDVKINWQHDITYSLWAPLIGLSFAVPLAWLLTNPATIIKSHLVGKDTSMAPFTSRIECGKEIIRQQGWRYLFTHGFKSAMVKAIPVHGITFLTYDRFLENGRRYNQELRKNKNQFQLL